MKRAIRTLLIPLFAMTFADRVTAYQPHVSIWGLSGSESQGQVEAFFPVSAPQNKLFYTAIQGGLGNDNAWYTGLGTGYRMLVNDAHLYGGYFFVDRNVSSQSNTYWVLSPGLETFTSNWESRFNFYIPVGKQRNLTGTLPTAQDACSLVVFKNHQQFSHHFSIFEEVGPGADAEAGYTFNRLHNTELHAGVYYFTLNNVSNIKGVEARMETPFNSHLAFAFETSYDNYQHATVVAGLRFNLDGIPPHASPALTPMQSHMVAPIPRNLGSLHTGSGIPVVKGKHDDGLFLDRDNIYFFTSQGGSTFVNAGESGTFENPLNSDQFTQSIVNQLGNNANLYFNSGTYTIVGTGTAPNAQINLLNGQALFGRTSDFTCAADGSIRPLLLGQINLAQGNNRLDSIRLLNSATDNSGAGSTVRALNIQNASNIVIFNSDIQAIADETTSLGGGQNNSASAIYANNSQVVILDSTISARALITGDNDGLNFATGIGGNTNVISENFTGNNFVIENSTITGFTSISGDNTFMNFAAGIGGNNGGFSSDFNNNLFTLTNSQVNAFASVSGDNSFLAYAASIGGNNGGASANFNNNQFVLNNTNLSALSSIDGVNSGSNSAVTIGGNNGGTTADFNNNQLTLTNSQLSANASVNTNTGINIASGIGGTNIGTTADFINNTIDISGGTINTTAHVTALNSGQNQGLGMNMSAGGNVVTINSTVLNILAQILGGNTGTNNATGLTANLTSIITINNSTINVAAEASGTNSAQATSGTGTINASNTQFNVTP